MTDQDVSSICLETSLFFDENNAQPSDILMDQKNNNHENAGIILKILPPPAHLYDNLIRANTHSLRLF